MDSTSAFYVNSGSIDVAYDGDLNFVVETDRDGRVADVSAFVDLQQGDLFTVSPKVGAYADLVLELDANVSAVGCLFGCIGGDLLDLRIDESPELFAINRQMQDDVGRPVFVTAEGDAVARDARNGAFFDLLGSAIPDPGPVTPLLDGDVRFFDLPIVDAARGVIPSRSNIEAIENALGGRNAASAYDEAQKALTKATHDRERLNEQLRRAEDRLANPSSAEEASAALAEVARLAGRDYAAAVAAGDTADLPPKEGGIGRADDARAAAARQRDAANASLSRNRTAGSTLRTPGLGLVFDFGQADGNLLGAQIGVGVGVSAGIASASRDVGTLQVSLPDVNLRDSSIASGGRLEASTDAFPEGSTLDANRRIAKADVDLTTLLPLGPIPTGTYNATLGPLSLDVTTVSYNVGPELNVTQDVSADPLIVDRGMTYRFYDPTLFDPDDPSAGALSFVVDVNGVPFANGDAVHTVFFNPGDKVSVRGDGSPVQVQPSMVVDARVTNEIGLEVDLDGVFEAFALNLQAFGVDVVDIGPLIRHAHTLGTLELGDVFDRTFDLGRSTLPLTPFTLFGDTTVQDGRTAATALLAQPSAVANVAVLEDVAATAAQPVWIGGELFDPQSPHEVFTTADIEISGPAVSSLVPLDGAVAVQEVGPGHFRVSGYDEALLRQRSAALFAVTFLEDGNADVSVTRSSPMNLNNLPDPTTNRGVILQEDFDTVGVSALLTTDIDGDGVGLPETDGALLVRHLSGVTGDALIDGALGENATRRTGEAIARYIDHTLRQTLRIRDPDTGAITERDTLDFDASGGEPTPEVDGILFQRYLAGLRGADLTTGLATSATGESVVRFLEYGRASANGVNEVQFEDAADRAGADVFGLDDALVANREDGASGAGALGPDAVSFRGGQRELTYQLTTFDEDFVFEDIFVAGDLVSSVAAGSPTNFGTAAYADLLTTGVTGPQVTRQQRSGRLGVDEPLFVRMPDAAGYEYRVGGGFDVHRVVIDPQVRGNLLLPAAFDLYEFDHAKDEWNFSTVISASDPDHADVNGFLVFDFEPGTDRFRLFSHALPNVELHDTDNLAAPSFESIVGVQLKPQATASGNTAARGVPALEVISLAPRGLYSEVPPLEAEPIFSTSTVAQTREFSLMRVEASVERRIDGQLKDTVSMLSAPTLSVIGSDLAEDTLVIRGDNGPLRAPFHFQGGFRYDTLVLGPSASDVEIDFVRRDLIEEVEMVDLRGAGANRLFVDQAAIERNDPFGQRLLLRADADDSVFVELGWVAGATEFVEEVEYQRWTFGNAVLLVETGANVVVEQVDPDFNDDGRIDGRDIDLLQMGLVANDNDLRFDLNSDGIISVADRDVWLVEAGAANLPSGDPYLIGDANLDGVVDVSDFNRWNANKFQNTSDWTAGDFNADGVVDVSDFNQWNTSKFQSSAPRVAVRGTVRDTGVSALDLVFAEFATERIDADEA